MQKLTQINPESQKMIWLFFPCVFAVYMCQILSVVEKKKNEFLVLKVIAVINGIIGTTVFPMLLIVFPLWKGFGDCALVLYSFSLSLHVFISLVLTEQSINYENEYSDSSFTLEESKLDFWIKYFCRWFCFANWWIGIYALQRIYNTYSKD